MQYGGGLMQGLVPLFAAAAIRKSPKRGRVGRWTDLWRFRECGGVRPARGLGAECVFDSGK